MRCKCCNRIIDDIDVTPSVSNEIHYQYYGKDLTDEEIDCIESVLRQNMVEDDICYSCKNKMSSPVTYGGSYAFEDITSEMNMFDV